MSMSPEDLDRINGPGSYVELMAAREANKLGAVPPEAIARGLSKVGLNGVVNPEDSRRIHTTGEVPAVVTSIPVKAEGVTQEIDVQHE